MSALQLDGKVAVVTGGGVGLGRDVATLLIEQGARVAVLGRTRSTLDQVADALGENLLPVVADVSDPRQVRAAFSAIDAAFAGADILINNAAVYQPYRIEDATDTELASTFAINVLGPAYCIREAIPRMRRRGGGDIVNVSSESVSNPFPYLSAYAASKSALETLSQGLRNELRAEGIRVSIFRACHMTGENANVSAWPEGRLEQFLEAIAASGHSLHSGAGIPPATAASALICALTLPREANIDLLALRSS
ncbi:SDR family oxidoreductase [Stutzerimonas xanthomarina]|jgi:NAD(P)-dependent dehydrogenase (short-subunit alcohol dehydrogenase family)|uniref:SDR family oxidoreductase n=1 Tax=Stutzerimonas xanthomarina TaxID=271420 RepID=A0A427EA63_9GAMM|nr:SDR family oxidoreductase [Stutzerimonas xanthomarina]MCW8158366.1 SDR family oxidoreductase [Stutzerimonas stutzeri]RRV13476.1 SDR family oxidoreductase [Stutzerimonas xanthomarina]